jgi:hypothetical protein
MIPIAFNAIKEAFNEKDLNENVMKNGTIGWSGTAFELMKKTLDTERKEQMNLVNLNMFYEIT